MLLEYACEKIFTYLLTNQNNRILTHNVAYSYDNGGRLAQVIDSATNPPTTELYAWNNDNTLASSPGPWLYPPVRLQRREPAAEHLA